MKIHHAGERCGESHSVRDRAVSWEPDQLVALGHVVQKATLKKKKTRFKKECLYISNEIARPITFIKNRYIINQVTWLIIQK